MLTRITSIWQRKSRSIAFNEPGAVQTGKCPLLKRRLHLSLLPLYALLIGCSNNIGLRYDSPARPALMMPARAAAVIDDRARFRQIFCALSVDHGDQFAVRRPCEKALQRLDGEASPPNQGIPQAPPLGSPHLHIVLVPGIFGQCIKMWALPFQDGARYMRSLGYRVDTIDVDGRSSSVKNAAIIASALPKLLAPGKRLMIVGYSKGTSDILETLALYPDAIPAGSAVVTVSGVVSGTPLADQAAPLYRHFAGIGFAGCRPGDKEGVESLTRRHRLAWLADHPLPIDRSYFSVGAFTDAAHISLPLQQGHKQLSTIDARNDGQVLYTDAIIPGSHLLGYVNADHWAVTLPLAQDVPLFRPVFGGRNDYPREILLESITRFVEEQLHLVN